MAFMEIDKVGNSDGEIITAFADGEGATLIRIEGHDAVGYAVADIKIDRHAVRQLRNALDDALVLAVEGWS